MAVVAAAAAANSRRRREEYCFKLDKSFVSETATVEEKQDYASCTTYLYPVDAAGYTSAAVILLLLGIFAYRYWRKKSNKVV